MLLLTLQIASAGHSFIRTPFAESDGAGRARLDLNELAPLQ
jgi:hypothetical protein